MVTTACHGLALRLVMVPLLVASVAALMFGCSRLDPEKELAAAMQNLAAREYGAAEIHLNNVVQAQPDNAQARKLRGDLQLVRGDYAAAAAELERARSLGVGLDTIAPGLAEADTALGKWEAALQLLDSAAGSFDSNPLFWTLRAEAMLRGGRIADAERALDSGAAVGDGGSRAQLAHARIALLRNDSATAAAVLERALSASPDDPSLLAARAELYAQTERLADSAADYSRAADLFHAEYVDLREIVTLLALLQVDLARNELDAAEKVAARLSERAPNAAMTTYSNAMVDYRRGRFDEAATLLQPLVSASPNVIQFRALLGAVLLARGNLFQAEQQFAAVLAASPRDPAAIKLLAETRLQQQRPEAALSALRPIEGSAAQDPQIGLLNGLASLQAGDTEKALVYLEQAASLDPANELLKLHLARAYVIAGRGTDALRLLGGSVSGDRESLDAQLLRLFASSQDPSGGAEAAQSILKGHPRDPRALTAVASYYQSRGDVGRGRDLLVQAAELETSGTTARLLLAASFVQEGRSEDAERLLLKLAEQHPDDAQVLTTLAAARARGGALDEAADLLGRAADHSASVSPRLALAQLRMQQGRTADAKLQLDIARKAAPDNPDVMAALGALALAEGRAGDAVMLLRNAASQLPNRLGLNLALAQAQLAAGAGGDARDTLTKMLAVTPTSLPLRLALGETELRLGNAEQTLSIAAALKAEFPDQSGGYVLEGESLIATRRYATAADSLAAAFQRESTWRVLIRWVGALQLAGRADEALRAAERWGTANPRQIQGQLLVAGLLQAARRNDEALGAYEAVLRLDPDNVPALNNAAWLTHELGRPGALTLAERAYKLAGDNAAVLDTYGWILLSAKRESESIAQLSRAAKLAPDGPEIHYHLAKALVAGGHSAEARSKLTALLQGGREFQQRADAQQLLNSL